MISHSNLSMNRILLFERFNISAIRKEIKIFSVNTLIYNDDEDDDDDDGN